MSNPNNNVIDFKSKKKLSLKDLVDKKITTKPLLKLKPASQLLYDDLDLDSLDDFELSLYYTYQSKDDCLSPDKYHTFMAVLIGAAMNTQKTEFLLSQNIFLELLFKDPNVQTRHFTSKNINAHMKQAGSDLLLVKLQSSVTTGKRKAALYRLQAEGLEEWIAARPTELKRVWEKAIADEESYIVTSEDDYKNKMAYLPTLPRNLTEMEKYQLIQKGDWRSL